MAAIQLPTRRDEAWKWSDLRQALGDMPAPTAPAALGDQPVIVQLAAAASAYEELSIAEGEHRVLIERFADQGANATALTVALAPKARLTRVVLQARESLTLNHIRVRMEAGASFRQFTLAFGAKLCRLETEIEIAGENADVELNGVYLVGAARHVDFTSSIAHQSGHGRTRQFVRGAARAAGRGVFRGKIYVAPHAQKTDAEQHHDALILEEGGEIFAKPELEIHADDVSCAHGNTIGALDEKALFYMRARGIPKPVAEALLVEGFVREAIPAWLPEDLLEDVNARLEAWFGAAP